MTRLSKFPAKIAFCFCTLFCLYSPFVFSQQVDTAWVRRYNGPGNGDDQAMAVAVDTSGNVYVTGFCFDSTTRHDYCTIKYLPNGDTAWLRTYNGPGGFGDYAYGIAVDSFGNVYVSDGNNDRIQKFDGLGTYLTQWGTSGNGSGQFDQPLGVAVDLNTGNIYVFDGTNHRVQKFAP